jgi:hypothetical protein
MKRFSTSRMWMTWSSSASEVSATTFVLAVTGAIRARADRESGTQSAVGISRAVAPESATRSTSPMNTSIRGGDPHMAAKKKAAKKKGTKKKAAKKKK